MKPSKRYRQSTPEWAMKYALHMGWKDIARVYALIVLRTMRDYPDDNRPLFAQCLKH